MPTRSDNGGNRGSTDAVAELRALNADFDRRSEEWQRQLHAILGQHEDLEVRRRSALARGLREALNPPGGMRCASAERREVDLPQLVEAYERSLIEWAMAAAHGCQKDAAGLLGLGATTLNAKMKRFGLLRPHGHRPVPPGTQLVEPIGDIDDLPLEGILSFQDPQEPLAVAGDVVRRRTPRAVVSRSAGPPSSGIAKRLYGPFRFEDTTSAPVPTVPGYERPRRRRR
jgi:regulatory Fis family protein